MFGVKTFLKEHLSLSQLLSLQNDHFPPEPLPGFKLRLFLRKFTVDLGKQKRNPSWGHLVTFSHKNVLKVFRALLPFNPNNLGNWSIENIEPKQETAKVERELIWKMINLYNGDNDKLEGYVTSGATEANIFSCWLGRKFVESKGISASKTCLLNTSLTHYSITKAADVTGIPILKVTLESKNWGMAVDDFSQKVKLLYKKGYRGFLVPLTLGYTLTGTSDPFSKICDEIRRIKKELEIEFFVWIDAALSGLIEPFVNENFRPFSNLEIQTFLTDFHKFGFAPIPAGLILYRKELRQLIEKDIDYLEEKDNTLLGSRSGVTPVACWMIIHSLGRRGFLNLISQLLKQKNDFMSKYQNSKNLILLSSANSLNCGILLRKNIEKQKMFEKKYRLYFKKITIDLNSKEEEFLASKMFFLQPK